MAGKPEPYSVWEDSEGARLIVVALDDDEPDFWFVTAVPYEDRFDVNAIAMELGSEEWAAFAASEKLKQVGVEPGEYPI